MSNYKSTQMAYILTRSVLHGNHKLHDLISITENLINNGLRGDTN